MLEIHPGEASQKMYQTLLINTTNKTGIHTNHFNIIQAI
jgi:hypothetical protein